MCVCVCIGKNIAYTGFGTIHGLGIYCPSWNGSPTDKGGTTVTDLLSHQEMRLGYLEKTFTSNYAS